MRLPKPVVIRPPEAESAHDLALIGWIFLFLLSIPIIAVMVLAVIVYVVALYLDVAAATAILDSIAAFSPVLHDYVLFLTTFAIGDIIGLAAVIGFLTITYLGAVRNVSVGKYDGARKATITLAMILFVMALVTVLFTFGITFLPALFFLLAFSKLGEVVGKYGPRAVLVSAPPPGDSGPFPVAGFAPVAPIAGPPGPVPGVAGPPGPGAPGSPTCPTCGTPLYYSNKYRHWTCPMCAR